MATQAWAKLHTQTMIYQTTHGCCTWALEYGIMCPSDKMCELLITQLPALNWLFGDGSLVVSSIG